MSLAPGDEVRVSDRAHVGHHRTPAYLKGKRGRIVRVHGTFRDPETRAYGESGVPERRLYLVDFDPSETFGEARVLADVFEHWLERAG